MYLGYDYGHLKEFPSGTTSGRSTGNQPLYELGPVDTCVSTSYQPLYEFGPVDSCVSTDYQPSSSSWIPYTMSDLASRPRDLQTAKLRELPMIALPAHSMPSVDMQKEDRALPLGTAVPQSPSSSSQGPEFSTSSTSVKRTNLDLSVKLANQGAQFQSKLAESDVETARLRTQIQTALAVQEQYRLTSS